MLKKGMGEMLLQGLRSCKSILKFVACALIKRVLIHFDLIRCNLVAIIWVDKRELYKGLEGA